MVQSHPQTLHGTAIYACLHWGGGFPSSSWLAVPNSSCLGSTEAQALSTHCIPSSSKSRSVSRWVPPRTTPNAIRRGTRWTGRSPGPSCTRSEVSSDHGLPNWDSRTVVFFHFCVQYLCFIGGFGHLVLTLVTDSVDHIPHEENIKGSEFGSPNGGSMSLHVTPHLRRSGSPAQTGLGDCGSPRTHRDTNQVDIATKRVFMNRSKAIEQRVEARCHKGLSLALYLQSKGYLRSPEMEVMLHSIFKLDAID